MMKDRSNELDTNQEPRGELGPGLFVASIELRGDDSCRVRLLDGRVVAARIDDGVEPELIRECQAEGRRVLVCESPSGPIVVGALQTARAVSADPDGTLTLSARSIRLKAEGDLVLETGDSALRLSPAGVLRVEGDSMVLDVGSLVRFLAARVEFP